MRMLLICLALAAVVGCKSKSGPTVTPEPTPGSGSAAGSAGTECERARCGTPLGMPATKCDDGSVGGNTGRCLLRADSSCAWEIRECPAPKPMP
jgi:hypothetical protein